MVVAFLVVEGVAVADGTMSVALVDTSAMEEEEVEEEETGATTAGVEETSDADEEAGVTTAAEVALVVESSAAASSSATLLVARAFDTVPDFKFPLAVTRFPAVTAMLLTVTVFPLKPVTRTLTLEP